MPHLIISLFMMTICLAGCAGCGGGSSAGDGAGSGRVTVEITNSSSEVFSVNAELAVTDEQRRLGLMHRKSLGEDDGMLFVFEDESTRSFWMKNTLIPLDMIFIDSSGGIVDINHEAVPHTLDPYISASPAKYVLEVNGGYCDERNIRTGDRVLIPGHVY